MATTMVLGPGRLGKWLGGPLVDWALGWMDGWGSLGHRVARCASARDHPLACQSHSTQESSHGLAIGP
eukprot:111023-Alexandrium_andersonii.AAC.1